MPRWICWSFLLGLGLTSSAQAHFLFIRILPPAADGRFAEVYFSEQAEAGDPQFVDKIAGTELWTQTTPGKFEPLKVRKAEDRLRCLVPDSPNLVVIGSCTYGVLPRKTPFLLRHFPKAMVGDPETLDAMKPFSKIPLEITAKVKGDSLHLTALREGKPFPNVEFNTLAKDLSGTKLKAGEDGSVTWKPPSPGRYSVYISHFHKTAGQLEGKKYDEVRDFATLWFNWPMTGKEK